MEGPCRWLLYEHSNFNGQEYLIDAKDYPSLISKSISSARALPPPGTQAIALFQHGAYQGRMLVLYGSDPDLRAMTEFNDVLSSFIVIGGHWTLYEDTGYHGRSATFGPGDYRDVPPPLLGNDRLSSVYKH